MRTTQNTAATIGASHCINRQQSINQNSNPVCTNSNEVRCSLMQWLVLPKNKLRNIVINTLGICTVFIDFFGQAQLIAGLLLNKVYLLI